MLKSILKTIFFLNIIFTYLSYILFSLANASRFAIGSEPADRRNISGVVGPLSWNDAFKLNAGGSMNDSSIKVMMNF